MFRVMVKYFLILVTLSLHLVLAGAVNYSMPSYDVTKITGMEVKRVDKDGPITKSNPADGPIRDVYFIFTEKPESGKVMTYRNEDTRWGFPPYFKFNSADVQASAQAYANNQHLVQIKYYGWRLQWFNEFKNIVSIKPIDEAQDHSNPWFSYVLYALLALTFFLSVQFIRGWADSER